MVNLFFGQGRENNAMREAREAAAKRVCDGCPARQECFEGAVARAEPHGVWGGRCFPLDSARDRRRAKRARARAAKERLASRADSAGIDADEGRAA